MFRTTLRFAMLGWFVCLPVALSGCGGKSSDVDDGASDSDASSDGSTATGGAQGDSGSDSNDGGTSSSGAAGGSGGTSGDAGSTGGASTGGNGGSTSAGDGSDGASDTSTTSSGGTGQSDTSSSDTSTTGVVNPTPPPDLVQGCAQVCMAETGSGCASAPNASDCAGACVVITRVPSCNDVVREFFECAEEDATTSCSDEGDVVFDACVSEQLAAYSCIFQNAPDADLEEPCETYCSGQAAADCDMSEDLAGCVLGCTAIPTVLPTCEELWVELLACTENEEFTCNDDGEPTVQGCGGEYLGFLACAYPELGE